MKFIVLSLLQIGFAGASAGSAKGSPQCFVAGECVESPLIGMSIQETENDCLADCQQEMTCGWFTFDPTDKLCELFKSCNVLSYENCPQCVSGERTCTPNLMCNITGTCANHKMAVPGSHMIKRMAFA